MICTESKEIHIKKKFIDLGILFWGVVWHILMGVTNPRKNYLPDRGIGYMIDIDDFEQVVENNDYTWDSE